MSRIDFIECDAVRVCPIDPSRSLFNKDETYYKILENSRIGFQIKAISWFREATNPEKDIYRQETGDILYNIYFVTLLTGESFIISTDLCLSNQIKSYSG